MDTILDSITIDIECSNCHKHIHKTVSSPKPATQLRSSRGMKIDPRFLQANRSMRATEKALQHVENFLGSL